MTFLNRLSIRTRITLGSFLLAVIFFAGSAVFVHHQVESVVNSSTMQLLESDAAPYVAAGSTLPAESLEPPGEDQLVAVVDPGTVVRLTTLPHGMRRRLSGFVDKGPGGYTARTSTTEYRVLVSTVATPGGDWTVVTARSEASNRIVLDRLTAGLAWGLATLTILFAVVSWLLTGASLRPVTRLRREAETLVRSGSTDLLPIGPQRDEVGELAVTLNSLISSLRASAEREKQMVSDASHELRTPLAILQAQLELLRSAVPEAQQGDVAAAEAAGRRMTRLVANLLELSRIEAHSDAGTASFDELQAEVVEAVDRARFSAAKADITIYYDVSDAGRSSLAGIGTTAATFGRIIDNLVTNAITALADSGEILVALTRTDEGILLVVSDDGPGMSEEFLPRAFDRFSREDPTRATGQSTGLGLAIVAAAVDAAHGTVELDASGVGLRAIVRIPSSADPAA